MRLLTSSMSFHINPESSPKDSLDAQYKADERGRVFDRPCQVLDDGDLDEH